MLHSPAPTIVFLQPYEDAGTSWVVYNNYYHDHLACFYIPFSFPYFLHLLLDIPSPSTLKPPFPPTTTRVKLKLFLLQYNITITFSSETLTTMYIHAIAV